MFAQLSRAWPSRLAPWLVAASLLASPLAAAARKGRQTDPSTETRPVAVEGGGEASPPLPAPAAGSQEARLEFERIRQRLAEVQQGVLSEDPELRATHEATEAAIEDATRAADPEFDAKLARIAFLAQQVATARQAEGADPEEIRRAMVEATEIQRRIAYAQADAMAKEPLRSRVAEVRDLVLGRMTALDAEVPAMLARLEALVPQPASAPESAPAR